MKQSETLNNLELTDQRRVVWTPTPLIRWKKIEIDKLRYEKVLQQLWRSGDGYNEWRNIPEED